MNRTSRSRIKKYVLKDVTVSFIVAVVAGFLSGFLSKFIKKLSELPNPHDNAEPTIIPDIEFLERINLEDIATPTIAMLTAIGAFIGFISKTMLDWRKDVREEQKHIRELAIKDLEIENLRSKIKNENKL